MPERSTVGTPGTLRTKVFVVLNPHSGAAEGNLVQETLERYLNGANAEGGCQLQVHTLTPGSDVPGVVRAAIAEGARLVVAAGGDGTVSAVADGVVGTTVPIGIVPLGTANVMARELGIPVDLEAACQLLAAPHRTVGVDAMQVGTRVYLTQVGIGIDALMIRDTAPAQKRRFGRVAYLWTGLLHLMGVQPCRFSIAVDDRHVRPRASLVVIANAGVLGQPPLRWGPDIRADDGRVDLCVVKARNVLHYLAVGWYVVRGLHHSSPNVSYLTAERAVAVSADRTLPVQADGEIIGETPVQVQVVRNAVQIVVPPQDEARP